MATAGPISYSVPAGGALRAGLFDAGLAGGITLDDLAPTGLLGSNPASVSGSILLDDVMPSGGGRLGLPAWRTALSDWQWVELSGTSMSSALPTSPPTGYGASARVNAWCGAAADRVNGRLIMGPGQGHGDGSGNDVLALDLNVDAPGPWSFLRQPSGDGAVISISGSATHYLDGRPPAVHNYYALHHVAGLNRLLMVGAAATWQLANSTQLLYAFDLTSNDWDGANTSPNVAWGSAGVANPTGGQCQDAATGDVYFIGVFGQLRRFNASTSTVTALASIAGVNADCNSDRPWAYDTARGRLVCFGDAYLTSSQGRVWTNDGGAGAWATITFTGTQATAFAGGSKFGAEYVAAIDRFLVKAATGSTLYVVHPTTWAVELQATTGGGSIANAINGPYSKFRVFPSLRAAVYYPAYTSQVWALALPTS